LKTECYLTGLYNYKLPYTSIGVGTGNSLSDKDLQFVQVYDWTIIKFQTASARAIFQITSSAQG